MFDACGLLSVLVTCLFQYFHLHIQKAVFTDTSIKLHILPYIILTGQYKLITITSFFCKFIFLQLLEWLITSDMCNSCIICLFQSSTLNTHLHQALSKRVTPCLLTLRIVAFLCVLLPPTPTQPNLDESCYEAFLDLSTSTSGTKPTGGWFVLLQENALRPTF